MQPDESPQTPQTEDSLPLPQAWPGAFGAYKFSKQAVKLNLNAIVGWELIGGIIAAALVLTIKSRPLADAANYIIASLITATVTPVLIAGVRQRPVGFGDALSKGTEFWFKIFLLDILVDLSVVASLMLLIVPFFFVWPRLVLANYFLVDKDMGVIEAYKASWHATKGNASPIYGILGAEIAMGLLVITIIGIPFSIYFLIMYSAAHALLYEIITARPAQAANPAAAETVS